MFSRLLVLCSVLTVFSAACTSDEDCNNLGRCMRGKCICFEGVLGDNCEGKNMCHAQLLQTRYSTNVIFCNMGGNCTDVGHGLFECSCRPGFSGPHCETFTCRSDASCHERGQCNLDDSHTDHGHCKCYYGYSGRDCYYDTCAVGAVNRLNQHLCNSGGDCVVFPGTPVLLGTIYRCNCRNGFSEDTCESFSCSSDRDCANSGTCDTNTGNCTCVHESFTGKDCGIANCGFWTGDASGLCSGHGTCVRLLKQMCMCNDGYTGEDCSSPLCNNGGSCWNGGTCITTGEDAGTCSCPGAYEGPLCESCIYPNSEQPTGPNDEGLLCVPDECMQGGFVCNGAGSCIDDYGSWTCSCSRTALNIGGVCVPNDEDLNKCVITSEGPFQTVCNDRGDCRYGMDGVWKCRCHFGSIRANDGNCYAIGCVSNGVVCSGIGDCVLSTTTGNYSCQCGGSYTGNGATCGLKSGLVATSIIVPILILGAVAGFLCWWFLCYKKNGGGCNCFGGSGAKPKRGKAIRLSDGDSLSVQSGISGFTSQL